MGIIRYRAFMTKMKEFWVFGYGSLMWRPGFAHVGSEPALIRGYHRRLCVKSHVHRGTPLAPGLVLGLDRGGSCSGLAYRVEAAMWDDTLAYLRTREQVTMVYREAVRPVRLLQSGSTVEALTYLVDRKHPQYAGSLSDDELLALIRQGQGISGRCVDYVVSALTHLRSMDIHDMRLETLSRYLEAQAAQSANGAGS